MRCFNAPDHDPKTLVGERTLEVGEIDALIAAVEAKYRTTAP